MESCWNGIVVEKAGKVIYNNKRCLKGNNRQGNECSLPADCEEI